jgi:hypothetical protein
MALHIGESILSDLSNYMSFFTVLSDYKDAEKLIYNMLHTYLSFMTTLAKGIKVTIS